MARHDTISWPQCQAGARRVYDWCRVGAKHGFTAPVTRYLHSNGVAVFSLPRPEPIGRAELVTGCISRPRCIGQSAASSQFLEGAANLMEYNQHQQGPVLSPTVQYSPDTLQGMSQKSHCLNFVHHLRY